MYVRPQAGASSGPLRVPGNYSGNAFRAPFASEESEPPKTEDENITQEKQISAPPPEDTEALLKPNLEPAPAVSQKGGIGSEELLLLALVLLLSESDIGDDLVLFLILLLFIK